MSERFVHPLTGETMGGLGNMAGNPNYKEVRKKAYDEALARYEANNKDKIEANIANYVQQTPEEFRQYVEKKGGSKEYQEYRVNRFMERLNNDERGKAVQAYRDRMANPSALYTQFVEAGPPKPPPRLAGDNLLLDRGMRDRSGDNRTNLLYSGTPSSIFDKKPPAPLTGTTSEGVMANFQPDPNRDQAQNLLDQTIAGVEPDKGSTATPTPDQQRDASVQELDTKAGSAPDSGGMGMIGLAPVGDDGVVRYLGESQSTSSSSGSTESSSISQVNDQEPEFNYNYSQYGTDQPNFEYGYSNQDPGNNFFQEYTGFSSDYPTPNYQATFPEYMSEYSPKSIGDFSNFSDSYSQDNQYQYYEPYDSPAQYQADQMQSVGDYDMSNFMDFDQVPKGQNNFSEAGNFFATANAQMENAAQQETKSERRIRMAGSRGRAANRF